MTAVARQAPSVRSWPHAVPVAALVLWLPTMVPLWLGPLADLSPGVVTNYLRTVPVLPGVLLPVLLQAQGAWFWFEGAIASMVVFLVFLLAMRELPRPWSIALQVAVGGTVLFESMVFAYLLSE